MASEIEDLAKNIITDIEIAPNGHFLVTLDDSGTVNVLPLIQHTEQPQIYYAKFQERCFILDIVNRDLSWQGEVPAAITSNLTPKERSFMKQKWGVGMSIEKLLQPDDYRQVDSVFAAQFV